MATASSRKRTLNTAEIPLLPSNFFTGVWTPQNSGNIYTMHKAAAATTTVAIIPVPKAQQGGFEADAKPSVIEVNYLVTTAALTSAPTAVLNKLTKNTDGTYTRTAVTQVLTFSGLDTVGTATGAHNAVVTITTPAELADNETLQLALTMNEAATSVLDINALTVTYT